MARKHDLGRTIWGLMELVGISVQEMSAALQISESTFYWRMKAPMERMRIADLYVIAKKCGTSPAWILGQQKRAEVTDLRAAR